MEHGTWEYGIWNMPNGTSENQMSTNKSKIVNTKFYYKNQFDRNGF